MSKLRISAIALAVISLSASAHAAAPAGPNLAGTYRCQPDINKCDLGGQTFTVTQAGNVLTAKNEKGEFGTINVTSNITLSAGPPWSMLGVISTDGATIQWSNGTIWHKQ